jgi:hypothetical protein
LHVLHRFLFELQLVFDQVVMCQQDDTYFM